MLCTHVCVCAASNKQALLTVRKLFAVSPTQYGRKYAGSNMGKWYGTLRRKCPDFSLKIEDTIAWFEEENFKYGATTLVCCSKDQ